MPSKPKQWFLADEDEKFRLYHYEAVKGRTATCASTCDGRLAASSSCSIRSNAIDDGERWLRFDPPQANYAVAKRRAFELVARAAVPI
jgi:hypothetical protein